MLDQLDSKAHDLARSTWKDTPDSRELLFRTAHLFGGYAAHGAINKDTAWQRLSAACETNGLAEFFRSGRKPRELAAKFNRSWRKGLTRPARIPVEFNFEAEFDEHPGDGDGPSTEGRNAPILRLNETHAVLPVGGHERILTLRGRQDYSIGSAEDLKLRYLPEWTRVTTPDGEKRKPLAVAWLGSKFRRSYPEGMTFLPGKAAPAGMFNTFRGLAIDPDTGPNPEARCPLILAHLRFVFGEDADWGFDWLAQLFQEPWVKPGSTIIVRGLEGAGKDIPAEYLQQIMGTHYVLIDDPKHLTGSFNAHLSRALFVHVSDTVWGGDRAVAGKLRSMVTQRDRLLEHKGQDPVKVSTFNRFWMSTNAKWAIEAARGSRRWFIVEVPNDKIGDVDYFNALAAEMDGDGPAALLAWLLARKITSNLRKAPETAALAKQRIESLRDADAWIAACVDAGEILGAAGGPVGGDLWPTTPMPRSWFRDACETWLRGGRHRGDMPMPSAFGQILAPFVESARLPRDGAKHQTRGYRLIPLEDARSEIHRIYGGGRG